MRSEASTTTGTAGSTGTGKGVEFVADRGDAGQRIDLVVRRHLASLDSATRTRVQTWITGGLVTVNGVVVRRVATRMASGDIIAVHLPASDAPARRTMMAEDRPLDVIYEDEQLLVVNKPAGLVVHPTYRHETGSVMNALLWHARDWPSPLRPSIVGRLDKLTSGIVLVAKTAAVHARLQRAMHARDTRKEYLAVVYGRVKPSHGRIDLKLARDRNDRRRVVALPAAGDDASRGLASLTTFERLASIEAPRVGLALVGCRLHTGRMHQIRVHLAARGWPIVGDSKYGAPHWSRIADPSLAATLRAFPRQALHAWRLSIPQPHLGRSITVEAPLPADMKDLLAQAGLPLNPPNFRTSEPSR